MPIMRKPVKPCEECAARRRRFARYRRHAIQVAIAVAAGLVLWGTKAGLVAIYVAAVAMIH